MEIPILKPVFNREYGSGLYDLKMFYLSTFLACLLFSMFYPILVGILVFAFINPIDDSLGNYMGWISGNLMSYSLGTAYGHAIGSIFDS